MPGCDDGLIRQYMLPVAVKAHHAREGCACSLVVPRSTLRSRKAGVVKQPSASRVVSCLDSAVYFFEPVP